MLDGSDIVAKKAVLEPAQWGVNIDKTISLCDCSDILPEIVMMSVVISNKIWNPLLADQRSALYREAKYVVEREVQLLLNSTDAKVSKKRGKHLARQKVEAEVKEFVPLGGHTAALLGINMTESHFDNHITVENYFIAAVRLYNNYTGTGVFGQEYRWYQKNIYDVLNVMASRDLPVDALMAIEIIPADEVEENLLMKLM